LVKKTRL